MKVTPEYLVLLTIILFALYAFNIMEKYETFVCSTDMIKTAYQSKKFKPRRPEHTQTVTKDDKEVLQNKVYDDSTILANFRVEGVPDNCIIELVKVWQW
jgi:hypothetical protein